MMKFSQKSLEGVGRRLAKYVEDNQKDSLRRVNLAVNIIYKTASAKRPMIGVKGHRVSDPSAAFGVPVAEKNGGRLKAAIKKEVTVVSGHIRGRVWVDSSVPYAKRIEYGFMGKKDSAGRLYHQLPRPFIRPAWNLNVALVQKILHGNS